MEGWLLNREAGAMDGGGWEGKRTLGGEDLTRDGDGGCGRLGGRNDQRRGGVWWALAAEWG